MTRSEMPFFCTGCTCRMTAVHSQSIDPPEPKIDPWCEIHGYRDADYERDSKIDSTLDKVKP